MTALLAPEHVEYPAYGLESLTLELSMARGLDQVMAAVRNRARLLVGADGITFVLRDRGRCFYADEDAISPLWKGQRFPLESCISGWAMLHQQPVVIEDIYLDDRIPHAVYRPTFVKSLAMMPVREDDPVGAIGAYWSEVYRPTDEQLAILRHIANSAAVAMTNVRLMADLEAAREEAVKAREAIIMVMGALAETRDNETGNHLYRTQAYVRLLADAAFQRGIYADELNPDVIDLIFKTAPLHDIGKIGIPDRILLKPGRLDDEGMAEMRTHAELGRDTISAAERHLGANTPFFEMAKQIAYTHHERWNGMGYPQGLVGSDIPLPGRLMAIADVYDALVSERVYKKAMRHDDAVEMILSERGRHFDPALVDVFAEIADQFASIYAQFADAKIDSGQ